VVKESPGQVMLRFDEPVESALGSAAAATGEGEDDVGAPTWLALAALIVGALGLMAGGASLVRSRERRLRRGAGA
jgi:hypothetical protein